MSPPTQRSGAPPPRERPAPESSSRRQATGHPEATSPGRLDDPELLVGVLVQLPLNYGRDWLDADQWVDRDGRVYSGDGPFLNRPLRRLRRALRGWLR